ncbi:MAG TPA: helix-turn-helix domain-containing protein [Victivallales bacterium]|nr:helix-turn-helix domain-containing protein [Victivallales bacterium]
MFNCIKFKNIRKQKKITQFELAKILGRNIKTIQRWEAGITLPAISDIYLLSDILGIPFNEIGKAEIIPGNSKPYYYDNLNNLDKSIIDISTKTDTEKQRLFIKLQKENEMLKWKLKEKTVNDKKYSTVINSIDTLIYTKDKSLKYTFINHYFLSYFNISNSGLVLGHRNNDIWQTKLGWNELTSIEQNVLRSKAGVKNRIISIPSLVGSPRIGSISIEPIFDPSGKFIEIIGYIKDVTADEIVKEKFFYMESILNEFEDIIWIIKMNPYKHYIYLNKAIENIYEISINNFYKDVNYWVQFVNKEDKKLVKSAITSETDSNLTYRITVNNKTVKIQHSMFYKIINGERIKFGIAKKKS